MAAPSAAGHNREDFATMAKFKPVGKAPSRRASRKTALSPDEARGLVATEITARLQQIAEVHTPSGSAASRAARPNPFGPKRTGAEVADANLLSGNRPPSKARVIAINAFPHPEEEDCIILQLDGWEGHLQLTIPRDRAVMLMARLQRAIEDSGGPRDPAPRRDAPPVDLGRARAVRPNRADRRRLRASEAPIELPEGNLSPIDDGALTALATEQTGKDVR
jgi:hypothetical protein